MKSVRKDFVPAKVTACTIVYAPQLEGFWEQALEITEICLRSMRLTTEVPFDLFVLDNGSCEAVRDALVGWQDEGLIQCLLLSERNMGKAGAWNVLMPSCPGELIAYSDNDMLFRPGWLEASLEILEAFPEAGMITARPSRVPSPLRDELCAPILANKDLSISRGDLIPRDVIAEHARSVGAENQPPFVGPYEDILVRRGDIAAFAYAAHYQFVTSKKVVARALPIHAENAVGGIKGGVRTFDTRAADAGYFRLATTQALVRHIGNKLSSDEIAEFEGLGTPILGSVASPTDDGAWEAALRRLAEKRRIRKLLEKLYISLFKALR